MTTYTQNDLSKKWARTFNFPEAQAVVMKDSDDYGQRTVSVNFHSDGFGEMSYHEYPKDNETYEDLFRRMCSKRLVAAALGTVLKEMNLLADRAREGDATDGDIEKAN